MKKKFFATVVIALIAVMLHGVVQADEVSITINGEYLLCDVPPQIVEDRTMVPMRAIFEALNYSVDYDDELQIIRAEGTDETIFLTIGDNEITKFKWGEDANFILMDVAPMIINDRTFVPLRAVAEMIGCDVDWDGENYTVSIATTKLVNIVDKSELNGANNYEADFATYDGNSYYYFAVYDKLDDYGNNRKAVGLFKETNGNIEVLYSRYTSYGYVKLRGLIEYGSYVYFVNDSKLCRVSKNGGSAETLADNIIDICQDNNMLYYSKSNGIYCIGFGKISSSDFELKSDYVFNRNDEFASNSVYSDASERLLVKDGYIYYATYKELRKVNINTGESILISDTSDADTININVVENGIYFNDDKDVVKRAENSQNARIETLIHAKLAIWDAADIEWLNAGKDGVYFLVWDEGDVSLGKFDFKTSKYEMITDIGGNTYYDNRDMEMAIAGDYAFITNPNDTIANIKYYRINLKDGTINTSFYD